MAFYACRASGATRALRSRYMSSGTTVDQAELRKFAALSNHWWNDTTGPFAPLHSMNQVRVPLIRDAMVGSLPTMFQGGSRGPLDGIKILDVGAGGGILSEALARLGADVIGIDAGSENVAVAAKHAALDPALKGRLHYRCTTAEAFVEDRVGAFDCVVSSEVIEHVSNIEQFSEVLCHFVKPGGALVITTINRTVRSFAAAVLGAEYVLRMVAPGTHEWAKFVKPEELRLHMHNGGLVGVHEVGFCYNPVKQRWTTISDTAVNYGMVFRKPVLT